MSQPLRALIGAQVFAMGARQCNQAVLYSGQAVVDICDQGSIPDHAVVEPLDGGLLIPGYVDLQVNGGGGVLFNDQPDVAAIQTICAAHARCATTALLVTLITASAEITDAAIQAAIDAHGKKVPGFLGLHLEGPHLSVEKKGAHDAALIRKMNDADVNTLLQARARLPFLKVTVAPESVSDEQIAALCQAGIVVSLGHSNVNFDQANRSFAAGARCATHLYNAMRAETHRQPGLAAAALVNGGYGGLIADGHHVHPAVIRLAIAAKQGPGKLFLVSDAMPSVGTSLDHFFLDGRKVTRRNGKLTLQDGTLAGADLTLHSAVKVTIDQVGLDSDEAIRMATCYPAECLGAENRCGRLTPGSQASFVWLNDKLNVKRVWQAGCELDLG